MNELSSRRILMRHYHCLIACAVALLIATYPLRAQKAAKPETAMTITVTDKTTGEPISAAEISTQSDGGQQKFSTDDSGRCDISVPSAPRYLYIKVKKAGYAGMAASWQGAGRDRPIPT